MNIRSNVVSMVVLSGSLMMAGTVSAQSQPAYNGAVLNQSSLQGTVTRVESVYDSDLAMRNQQRRCYSSQTGQYTIEPMGPDGQNGAGDYQTEPPRRGSTFGRVGSSLLGGIIGAVIGSKIGNGTGSMIASSVGSAMGSVAGQSVYEKAQNQRTGVTSVCEPIPLPENPVHNAYDVTYRIGTQTNVLRTTQQYKVGDPITVNVTTAN